MVFFLPAKIIDGKAIAEKIKQRVKKRVLELKKKNIAPCLAVVLVGSNPASKVYINRKQVSCDETGIVSRRIELPEIVSEQELLQKINELNYDSSVHSILVQLPLPKHIDEFTVLNSVLPEKDVDGFHFANAGKMFLGKSFLAPNTPRGIIELIKSTGTRIEGKHAVVVGRSKVVGKPTAVLLLQENATVTVCHSKTKNLFAFTKQADILVVAVGIPKLIKKEMVKQGAIVIDVGITKMAGGKLSGDVDFENVKKVAGFLSPVPGGVGPVTIAMLLENTVKACKMQSGALDE